MKQQILNQRRLLLPILFFLMAAGLWAPSSLAQTATSVGSAAAARLQMAREIQTRHLHLIPTIPAEATRVAVLKERQTKMFDGTEWTPSERTVYSYDGLSRTEELVTFWDGEKFVIESRTTFSPVATRSLRSMTEDFDIFHAKFVPRERFEYTVMYDWSTGQPYVTLVVRQEWNGSAWVNTDRMSFELDSNIEVIASQSDIWSGAEWQPIYRYFLTQEGDDVVQVSQTWDGSWVNSERVAFLNQTVASLQAAMSEVSEKTEDYGLLFLWLRTPDYLAQEWDGSGWVDLQHQTTVHWYDVSTGRITKSDITAHEWTGETWAESYRQSISFDQAGRADSTMLLFSDDGSWLHFITESYLYDDMGDMISALLEIDFFGTGMMPMAKHEYKWNHIRVGVEDGGKPTAFALEAAYPNPFNPATNITYQLGTSGQVAIRVYDALGRHVSTLFDGQQAAGRHTVRFEAADLPSGLYLVRFDAPGFRQTRSVTLAK